jgi:uncharacterized protein (TIGR00369 family)
MSDDLLGGEMTEASEGRVRLLVRARDELRNAPGAPVHGGVFSALVDMAVGAARSTMHEASAGGVGQTTLDLNVSFIGAGTGDVVAEGRIRQAARGGAGDLHDLARQAG